MTDRSLGNWMIGAGVVLICAALGFGSYLRPLELALGAVLLGMGLLIRRHLTTNADRQEAQGVPSSVEPSALSAVRSEHSRQQTDAEDRLHDAFAVVQEGGRLRAVEPAEVDERFAPVLARWRKFLPATPGKSKGTDPQRGFAEMAPDLRRDVMDLERYLGTLVFKRQAAQEHYFRQLDDLEALLHDTDEEPPARTLIFRTRQDFFDVWHPPSDRAGSAGEDR